MMCYSAALLCITLASRKIDSTIVTGLGNLIATVVALTLAIPFVNKNLIETQRGALVYAVLSGVFITIFSLAISRSLAVNKVAIVNPIVFGGSIFLTALVSAVVFKEKIGFVQGIGLLFMMIGLILVIYTKATSR